MEEQTNRYVVVFLLLQQKNSDKHCKNFETVITTHVGKIVGSQQTDALGRNVSLILVSSLSLGVIWGVICRGTMYELWFNMT